MVAGHAELRRVVVTGAFARSFANHVRQAYSAYWCLIDADAPYATLCMQLFGMNQFEIETAVGQVRVRAVKQALDPDAQLAYIKRNEVRTERGILVYGDSLTDAQREELVQHHQYTILHINTHEQIKSHMPYIHP